VYVSVQVKILIQFVDGRAGHLICMVDLKPVAKMIRAKSASPATDIALRPGASYSSRLVSRTISSSRSVIVAIQLSIYIVDQDWDVARHNIVRVLVVAGLCGEYVEVVVVVAGDGQVPHPALVVLRGGTAVGDSCRPAGRLEVLALLQLARGTPLVQVRVVEQVAAGGADDPGAVAGLDSQVYSWSRFAVYHVSITELQPTLGERYGKPTEAGLP
jgi:hypothetical protein